MGWWATALVCAQGLLGGVTVLFGLPAAVSVAHACLGQIYFCLMVCIAVLTGPRAMLSMPAKTAPGALKLQQLGVLTTGFILFQLILGATLRHTGLRPAFHLHLLVALFVTVHVLLLARRVFRDYHDLPDLVQPAAALAGLLGIQLVLGFYSWKMAAVTVTTAHVGVGALLLAASVILTLQSYRRLLPL